MPADKWDVAIAFVLAYEGGLVDDPRDAGGLTKYGISQRAYPSEDIRALTVDRAKEIYRRDYWDACHCDELPFDLAVAVMDCAVNQGAGTARRLLQVALGVKADGVVGPQTIGAAFKAGQNGLLLFLMERARLYMRTHGVEIWGGNWGTRLVELSKKLVEQQAA